MNDNEYFDDAHPLYDSDEYNQHESSHRHAQRKKRQRRDSSQSQQHTKNDDSYSYYTRSACSDAAASKSTNNRTHQSGGNVLDLTVIGKKCVLHRNDDLAEQLDQEKHLIDLLEDHQPSHRQHEDNEDPYSSDMDEFYSQQDSGVDNGGIHASSSPPGECNSTWTDIIHPFVNSTLTGTHTTTSTSYSTNGGSRTIPKHHHLFVDRYDARTLLDNVSIHEGSIYSHKREANDLGFDHDLTYDEKQVIDIERFGDLKLQDEDVANEKYRECPKAGGDEGTAIPGGSHKLESPTRASTHIDHSKTDDVDAGSAKEDGFELDEKERAMLPLGIAIVSTCTVDRREIRIQVLGHETQTVSYIMPILVLILVP